MGHYQYIQSLWFIVIAALLSVGVWGVVISHAAVNAATGARMLTR